jgi:pteridine reductase
MKPPVVLVTGAAQRIGAEIARVLHADGWRVVIHYRSSAEAAIALAAELNSARSDSAALVQADLGEPAAVTAAVDAARACWGGLDALVNNASSYFPTPLASLDAEAVDDLLGSNLRAPLFAIRAFARESEKGAVVNIIDVHARRVRKNYAPYLAAKSGLWTLTEALALELAPRVRVNAVAPGHIIWAVNSVLDDEARRREAARIPMARLGEPADIARAVRFLLSDDAAYITGAVLPVDGGVRLAE